LPLRRNGSSGLVLNRELANKFSAFLFINGVASVLSGGWHSNAPFLGRLARYARFKTACISGVRRYCFPLRALACAFAASSIPLFFCRLAVLVGCRCILSSAILCVPRRAYRRVCSGPCYTNSSAGGMGWDKRGCCAWNGGCAERDGRRATLAAAMA